MYVCLLVRISMYRWLNIDILVCTPTCAKKLILQNVEICSFYIKSSKYLSNIFNLYMYVHAYNTYINMHADIYK